MYHLEEGLYGVACPKIRFRHNLDVVYILIATHTKLVIFFGVYINVKNIGLDLNCDH